jgi:P-type E1-E2 ATPase
MDIVTPSFLVVLAFVVGGGVGIYLMRKIVKSFMRRQYGVDVLAFLAIAATLLASEYLATLIIVLMLVTGELLERYAGRRARRELSRLITHRPKYVHLVGGRDVLARKIKVGRRFFVKTGEMILLDGVLVSDVATLDTANITGEAAARTFTRNAHLVSGSLNIGAPIVIRATARLVDSQFSQLEKAVSDIEKHPAPFVRLADRYAVPFTVISLVIAGAAWVISGDFSRFAEVLVLASPCPLILAAPIAYISGMSKAFGRGILVKNGTYLEK